MRYKSIYNIFLIVLAAMLSSCSVYEENHVPVNLLSAEDIPAYTGMPYVELNGNVPSFDAEDMTAEPFESYSDLDALGRCGAAYANIGKETMPTAPRGEIGQVKPTGWHTIRYDFIEDMYLYNRCHLIAYQLAGENANVKNLITGTRYMNVQGMLPFEERTAEYVTATGNHVLYRATPLFIDRNLVASGVQLEAMSVEDNGAGLSFNVFCFDVQPGIVIDYATGDSHAEPTPEPTAEVQTSNTVTYILNTNTKKFHYPDCPSVSEMKEKNKREFSGTREEAIAQHFSPCGLCRP